MTEARFTLRLGEWFGLTMFPGYGDAPYHSPIRIDRIMPLGDRCFEMTFLNLAYASGVQSFVKRLRTLRRADSHLVAEETEVKDRTYAICKLTPGWMEQYFPNVENREPFFDNEGRPILSRLLKLAG